MAEQNDPSASETSQSATSPGQAAPGPLDNAEANPVAYPSPPSLPLAPNAHRVVADQIATELDDEAVLAEAVRVALERHHRRKPESTSPAIILIWLLWLMGNWGVALYLDGTHRALRWMAFGCMTGIMLIWPAVRLSLDIGGSSPLGRFQRFRPGISTLLVDGLGMLAILMVVIAVLSYPAGWGPVQVAYLAGSYVAWSMLIAAIIFIGSRSHRGEVRTWAMLACIAVMFSEPVLQSLLSIVTVGRSPNWTMWASPVEAVWAMTVPAVEWRQDPWLIRVVAVAIIADVLWIAAIIGTRGPRWMPSLVDHGETTTEA